MTNDAIKMDSFGVKCDTVGCDFKVSFGSKDEYASYLNKPCPVCSANLLTQEDYDQMIQILKAIDMANEPGFMEGVELSPEVAELIAKLENPEAQARLSVDFVDGVPVMSSDDPEIQGFIDDLTALYQKQGE